MNASWHKSHPMPKRATRAQRVLWHRAHAKRCACRPIPPDLLSETARRGASSRPKRRARSLRSAAEAAR